MRPVSFVVAVIFTRRVTIPNDVHRRSGKSCISQDARESDIQKTWVERLTFTETLLNCIQS